MPRVHVLRVFVGPDGRGGNPLGVVLDGSGVPPAKRQAMAAELGFSETVFVTDAARGDLRIFTPAVELAFAGHPLVGTAWLLHRGGAAVDVLRPPAGDVPTWADADGHRWIRGRPEWAPDMDIRQLPDPAAVDALDGPPDGLGFVDAWAWEDEGTGRVRCRVFAPASGIPEDEATGSAAVRLVAELGRPLVIRQGVASQLLARPGPRATADVGGVVALDEAREHPLPA